MSQGRTRTGRKGLVQPGDDGFSVVEILAAVTILVVVLLSLTNLLTDSLDVGLVSKQKEAAASLASDVEENAAALGLAALQTVVTPPCAALPALPPPPVLSACNFQQGYSGTQLIDGTTYTVTVAAITTTATPVPIAVTVTWTQRNNQAPSVNATYSTTSLVGS